MGNSVSSGKKKSWDILYLVILAGMALFPLLGHDYDTVLVSRILCYSILALSLDLLWGHTGLLSFGHGAFFGLGAYALGLTLKFLDLPGATYVGILFGIIGPMLLAALMGYFLFYGRVSGIYFGIITLAFTTICMSIAIRTFHLTGGLNGLYGTFLRPKFGIPGVWEYQRDLVTNMANYYTALVGFCIAFVLFRYIVRSPFGKILRALKSNEERLEFLGYNVANLKIVIFVIACGMAGFAGCMSVPIQFIAPTVFGVLFSVSIIIWVAVGGRGVLLGPIIGAFVVNYMETWLSTQFEHLWVLIMGLFFIFIIVFEPDGIMGLYRKWSKKKGDAKKLPDPMAIIPAISSSEEALNCDSTLGSKKPL